MSSSNDRELPAFLRSFEDLAAHFDTHFDGLSGNERGDRFLSLVRNLLPLTEIGQSFPPLDVSEKRSHDAGVDLLTAANDEGEILCAQSKYKIREAKEIDSIISKFKNYECKQRTPKDPQRSLFEEEEPTPGRPTFAVVTISKLKGILDAYESSQLASKEYYCRLSDEERIHFVDGPEILRLLEQLYRKTHLLPTAIKLESESGWLRVENVRIGVLTGAHIMRLHGQFGDALFFENIRSFLGVTSGKKEVDDRATVNSEILSTIREYPERMLERNNGLTFRAESIESENGKTLQLINAAIVNGCQTTICLVRSGERAKTCRVPAKVVVTTDGWDIAKAANFQNRVKEIDLNLARYLRPQLVHKAANDLGYAMDSTSETAASVIDAIYKNQVEYEEMRCLYLGLFSHRPNNLFVNNYAELRADVLQGLYQDAKTEHDVFPTIFLAVKSSRDALEECKAAYQGDEYVGLFKRFYHEHRPRYRSYLAVLAMCSAVRENLSERDTDSAKEVARMRSFLQRVRAVLENQQHDYSRCYLYAFLVLASFALRGSTEGSEREVAQNMYNQISNTPFRTLYLELLMRMDADKALGAAKQE